MLTGPYTKYSCVRGCDIAQACEHPRTQNEGPIYSI